MIVAFFKEWQQKLEGNPNRPKFIFYTAHQNEENCIRQHNCSRNEIGGEKPEDSLNLRSSSDQEGSRVLQSWFYVKTTRPLPTKARQAHVLQASPSNKHHPRAVHNIGIWNLLQRWHNPPIRHQVMVWGLCPWCIRPWFSQAVWAFHSNNQKKMNTEEILT